MAPIFKKGAQPNGKLCDSFGGHAQEEHLIGFRSVPVFDISQTEGKELPEVCQRLVQEGFDLDLQLFKEAANFIGFYVEEISIGDGSNGDCTHAIKRIRIEESNSSAQKCKTMAHELTHAILHENFHDRALAELEAESAAFLICNEIGIDSSTYSFGYLATWAGGHENASILIKSSANRIRDAATKILEIMNKDSKDSVNESWSECQAECFKAA
ncbi:MAG: ImmA/IrrE family metallo-endopeptidase [Acidimicrobiales bacterium]|nr:ImmA/IrrE family metallo-endopeptidase [Acidimicrobiales bacterium]